MTVARLLSLAALVALAGCEHVEWSKPGADPATVEADVRACRRQARLDAERRLGDALFLSGRGSTAPMRGCWPHDRARRIDGIPCSRVGSYGDPMSPVDSPSRRAWLEQKLTDRCLRERGYALTPVQVADAPADTGPNTIPRQ